MAERYVTPDAGVRPAGRVPSHPVQLVLTVLTCVLVMALLISQRHRFANLPRLLAGADWGWIALGFCALVASVGALASEQRRLISVRGPLRPLPSVLATTWAGNAISVSLPLVGSAAAAVFAYRRFIAIGVDGAAAAWTLAVSGIYSTVTFSVITAVGAIISGAPALAVAGAVTVLAVIGPVCLVLLGLHRPPVQAATTHVVAAGLHVFQRVFRRPAGDAREISSATLGRLTSLRLGRSSTMIAGMLAVVNWLFDLACLICAIHAVHGDIPWRGIILAWAVGSSASWLGFTPGGLGVVEIALGSTLIGAGLPADTAVAAALLYRASKIGLVLIIGGFTLLLIRRGGAPARRPGERRTNLRKVAGRSASSGQPKFDPTDDNVQPLKGTKEMSQYWKIDSLAGKSVIVTGAAQGIGRGIAEALGERGAAVFITDINAEKLQSVHEAMTSSGFTVSSVAADISLPASADIIVNGAISAFGHLDGLVNNAIAGNPPTPFADLAETDYDRVFNSGPFATFNLMKAAYPHLKRNGSGSIVNFASGAGTAGVPFQGAYAGAKEAIRGLSKSAMQEWGPDQIRVNMIAPYALSEGAAAWKAAQPDEFARSLQAVPLRRIGDVRTDVGAVVSFLVGDDATYLTGQTIFVDGGYQSVR